MEQIKPEIARNFLKKSDNIRYHFVNPSNASKWNGYVCAKCSEAFGDFAIVVENKTCGHHFHFECYMEVICSVYHFSYLRQIAVLLVRLR